MNTRKLTMYVAVILAITLAADSLSFAQPGFCGCPWAANCPRSTTRPAATTQPAFMFMGSPGRHRYGQRAVAAAVAPATSVMPVLPATTELTGMRGPGQGGGWGMSQAMRLIHGLLGQRGQIRRTTEEIPGGVMSLTVSDDPQVAQMIRQHVRQMQERLAAGQPIRLWDPLYAELFAQRQKIKLQVQDVPGGVTVRQTSEDPQVTRLIRQHAAAVGEFLAKGYDRVHQPTTLPTGQPTPLSSQRSANK